MRRSPTTIIGNRFLKILIIVFLLVHFFCYLGWGAFPAVGGLGKNDGGGPSKGSAGSGSISAYNQEAQQEDSVFFIAYSADDEEFFKDQNVTIQFLIINAMNQRIKIESLTSIFPSKFIFVGCNPLPNTQYKNISNNIYIKTKGLSSIDSSSYEYCNYTIRSKYPGNYVLSPTILKYSVNGISKNVSSDIIFLKIKNRPPEVEEMTIEPTPIRNRVFGWLLGYNEGTIKITMKDPDNYDAIKFELWSNIDGMIYESPQFSTNNTSSVSINHHDFSIGEHKIKLKLMDNYDGRTEHEMVLSVLPDYYFAYLTAFSIGTILVLCAIINTFEFDPKVASNWLASSSCHYICRYRLLKFLCIRTGKWYPWNICLFILFIIIIFSILAFL